MGRTKSFFAWWGARRSALTVGVMAVVAVTLILLGLAQPMPALASSGHLFAARSLYPHIIGTRLDSCSLCHTSYLPLLNYYGLTLWAYDHNFDMIASYDSDGDGWSNLDEIESLTNPGDPYDRPAVWTPEPTDVPEPTDTPVPTDVPEPTDTPVPTDVPEPTDTPVPTDVPEPTDTPVPTDTPEPTVGPIPDAFVDVTGPASVVQGEAFEISVVVRNVANLYGGQFRLTFDPVYLQAVNGSLAAGGALEPSVVGLASVDNAAGQAWFAVSRQGDQDALAGDVVLATLRFTAVAAVEATTLDVDNVLLGTKDATNIPVGGIDGHTLSTVSGTASVLGQVMLEGRAADNNDGAVVAIDGTGLSANTDAVGNFLLTGISPGTYDFTADAAGYLPTQCVGRVVGAPQTILASVQLVAGDVNDNGVIDITDAVAMGAAFGNPAANPTADVNNDGAVNVLDLILLAANFGAIPSPWVC